MIWHLGSVHAHVIVVLCNPTSSVTFASNQFQGFCSMELMSRNTPFPPSSAAFSRLLIFTKIWFCLRLMIDHFVFEVCGVLPCSVRNHREAELMREIASSAGIFDLLLNNYETLAYKSQVSVRSTCCGHWLILYHFTVKQTLLVTHNENLKLVQDWNIL